MMEREYTKEYRDLRIHCLYGSNPYDILNLSVRADEEQLRDAFRQAIMVLAKEIKEEQTCHPDQNTAMAESTGQKNRECAEKVSVNSWIEAGDIKADSGKEKENIKADSGKEKEEHRQILERLVYAYNILNDPQRRRIYDQDRTTEQIYKDGRSLRYHNQITLAQMESLMEKLDAFPEESSGRINVTFIAIVVSFLIVFESLLLIFTSGDSRLAVYILNACCLFAVATVELIRYRRSGNPTYSQSDDIWNHFFYDPLGLRAEILERPFDQWSQEDFSYIALFNRMNMDEYKEKVLGHDLRVYDLFKEVIDEQYKKIAIDKLKDQMDDRAIDKAYRLYKKWYDIMNDPELKIHLWELISEKEMKGALSSLEASDRNTVREALYRLYYYWNMP